MKTTTIIVPVGRLIFGTDRKYGGEGNIENLARSIQEHGLIHPPAVKESAERKGYYIVMAGRRRCTAVKSLGWKNVEVTVYAADADEEAIALAENVNRDDMHPLDEAENFKRQQDEGKTVEEIAEYYSRSVSGIHHRIRLTSLIDGIKTMFRDGKINLSGAALVAGLPPEDQEKFLKKFENKTVSNWDISGFIHSVQKLTLEHIADKKCEKCKKRTRNTDPGLFEDYSGLEDVCFDCECYFQKWADFIAGLIAGQGGETENNIILDRGIPEFVSRKIKTVSIGGEEYNLLAPGGHSWKETKKKGKTKTAWLVSWGRDDGSRTIQVRRVSYEKYERQAYEGPNRVEDPVKDYLIDRLPDISEEDQKTAAAKVKEKYRNAWNFRNEIKEAVLGTVVDNYIKDGTEKNLAAIYLAGEFSGTDSQGNRYEIGPDHKGIVNDLFGPIESFSEIPIEPLTQKIFLLLIASDISTQDMPDPDDSDNQWEEAENTLFWKFAGMSRGEYNTLYMEFLDYKIAEVLKESREEPAVPPDGEDTGDE